MKPRLLIVVGSTRPGRVGLPVARWFLERAEADARWEPELVDLAVIDLPFLDEPHHPRLRLYEHEHTRGWSATVEAADAIAVVTPEYNYGLSGVLKNAFDYLHEEWAYKPLGIVSYGGVSAGTRAGGDLRLVASSLRMFAIPEAVSIPFVKDRLRDGVLDANAIMDAAATAVLGELARVADALAPLRAARARC